MDLGGVKKVISPTFAGSFLASMRDASELEFFDSNGRMWAWISGLIYMPSDLAPVINSREEKVTLPETGYNEWRKTGYDSIVSFTKPPTGRIIVFDNSQNILYDSIVDAGSVYAPAGSFIECLGNIGDVLAIRVTPITK